MSTQYFGYARRLAVQAAIDQMRDVAALGGEAIGTDQQRARFEQLLAETELYAREAVSRGYWNQRTSFSHERDMLSLPLQSLWCDLLIVVICDRPSDELEALQAKMVVMQRQYRQRRVDEAEAIAAVGLAAVAAVGLLGVGAYKGACATGRGLKSAGQKVGGWFKRGNNGE